MDDPLLALPREVVAPLGPREKLRFLGASRLSDRDLLAALIGSGTQRHPVGQLADALLKRFGDLQALADSEVAEMQELPGLGEVGATRVAAAMELCRRLGRMRRFGKRLGGAADVDQVLRSRLCHERREQVWVLLLDTRERLLAERCVSVGSLVSSMIHPREVFRPAIAMSAAFLVLVHNHPSGDPTPSLEDHEVTARLREAGALLGIPLWDHVVVAAEGYRSFREDGWLPGSDPVGKMKAGSDPAVSSAYGRPGTESGAGHEEQDGQVTHD